MTHITSNLRVSILKIPAAVWRILAHSFIYGFALSIADILFNFYLVSQGYTINDVGLLSMVSRAAGMVMGLPIGWLIDRFGSQRAMIGGVIGYALGWAALLQAPALPWLIAAQFVVGACYLLAATAVTPLLALVTTEELRPLVFGMNASATLIVGLLGSAVGGVLPMGAALMMAVEPQSTVAYRVALTTVIGLSIVALWPVLVQLPAVAERRAAGEEESVGSRRLSWFMLLWMALPSFLLGVGGGAILPFQNLFFRDQFGLSDAGVGLTLSLASLGAGVGALLGAPVVRRIGLQRGAALLRLGATPAMLLMLTPWLPLAIIGFFARGFFIAASYPMNDALVMGATPTTQRGLAMSLMSLLWAGGWAISAVIWGWVTPIFGYGPQIVAAALAYALSALVIWSLRLQRSAEQTAA
ncbi:MFS transporter [Chloroflexus aggregans]|uniref:Major facilitator superfamily MFS_1 n=1 Tax=Chloroflexus aggregans (strain MD-66 / DSM 9485) TaxID=326427 RepID=B8G560_CHLAD|nr:MFS transporter [Chloroflexus aggregans]ACL23693.1 major facilitator superfamily MFS_1 [Chloroflexus aggregans DSM 9485]